MSECGMGSAVRDACLELVGAANAGLPAGACFADGGVVVIRCQLRQILPILPSRACHEFTFHLSPC